MRNDKSPGVDLKRNRQATNTVELDLAAYLDRRPEIGFARMLLNFALEPQDPFKPETRRSFRKGFVIAVVFWSMLAGWFLWFNLIR